MDGEFAQFLAGELTPAVTADPGKEFQRPFPIGSLPEFLLASRLGDHFLFVTAAWV
jgi:hypothetical protein